MSRPLTRAQALQNRAFLEALCRLGNIRLAAREVGIAPATLHARRAAHPAFAQNWDAALAVAQARLNKAGGCHGPEARPASAKAAGTAPGSPAADPHRTRGGEPVVVRRRDGRLQVRRAQPDKLTRAAEQAFLAALSATANVALSAAAAGAAEAAFYRRRRRHPGFAREWRMALQLGYARLEETLLAGAMPDAHEDDGWRHNEPPDMPPMTASEMLQLMHLHQKEVRFMVEAPYMRRRAGETSDIKSARVGALYRARLARQVEDDVVSAVLGAEPETPKRSPHEPPAPILPALDQVTGWSRASGKPPHHPGVPLFGGWRIEDLEGE